MLGLIKIVSGRLKIQSYSKLSHQSDEIIVAAQEEAQVLDTSSKPSMLDERFCNFHEITALGDEPAAFFDVLSPPYASSTDDTDSRHCHFYRKLLIDNTSEKKILKLERIDCPDHYYCDSVFYDKPDFMQ